jgi:hypothetical protein
MTVSVLQPVFDVAGVVPLSNMLALTNCLSVLVTLACSLCQLLILTATPGETNETK